MSERLPAESPQSQSLWWIEVNGKQEGPLEWRVIEELFQAGVLSIEDFVVPDGSSSWQRVGELLALVGRSGAVVQVDIGPPLVREDPTTQLTISRRRSKDTHTWFKIAVWAWLFLGLVWVVLMIVDWPFVWDGVLVARLSVFGGLALIATAVWILPRVWQITRSSAKSSLQVLRFFCAAVVFVVSTLILAGVFNAQGVARIAVGIDEFQAGSVSMLNAGVIEVRGPLSAGIAKQLRDQLVLQPYTQTVLLDSEGGWVREGERIGRLIRQFDLNTHADTECSSACAAAFVYGKRRTLAPGAYLGFHSASGEGTDPVYIQWANESLAQRLIELGASAEFVDRAFSTPADDIWYPAHSVLFLEGIIHDVTP